MIRAIASTATPRPTALDATARLPLPLILLLVVILALMGSATTGQRAAADEPTRGDEIQVTADGVAFQRGRDSDEVTYSVRPVGSDDEQTFSRQLTRDEQDSGWAAFREAGGAYPDGYCVVWAEVEDASSWRETGSTSVCNAAEPTAKPRPPVKKDDEATPAPTQDPTPTPTPTPTPSPTPSPSPSPTVSGTPSPSPSRTSPAEALVQNLQNQPPVAEPEAAAEQDDVISPLGWVAVLGGGALLMAGGALVLWRRLV